MSERPGLETGSSPRDHAVKGILLTNAVTLAVPLAVPLGGGGAAVELSGR